MLVYMYNKSYVFVSICHVFYLLGYENMMMIITDAVVR